MTENRNKIIKIRVNESEYKDLLQRSNKPRLAEWIRNYCLGARVPKANKIPPIDPMLLRQLAGLGNNLNQIARAINSEEWKPIDRVQIISALTGIQQELANIKLEHTYDDS